MEWYIKNQHGRGVTNKSKENGYCASTWKIITHGTNIISFKKHIGVETNGSNYIELIY